MGRRLRRTGAALAALLTLGAAAAGAYGLTGWADARADAPVLARRADSLIDSGKGPDGLGPERAAWLLAVQDPGFTDHGGVDMTTDGAGATTMTQSLSKRLAFDHFTPGLGKIRQTGYAMGLETRLTKDQIFALFLDTAQMGHGPGGWMTGFFNASQALYGQPPDQIDRGAFLGLVAVMIAPGRLSNLHPNEDMNERIDRIDRLVSGACIPDGPRDVWLAGCATKETL